MKGCLGLREGYLSQYFEKIAVKRLSKVEVDKKVSNQQELNGNRALQEILGKELLKNKKVRFIRFGADGEENVLAENGWITWYDARENHPTRTEYRLYFQNNPVMEMAKPNDLIIITKRPNGEIDFILVEANSTYENQLMWIFGIADQINFEQFDYHEIQGAKDQEINFAGRFILDELGIQVDEPEEDSFDEILKPYIQSGFPTTKIFSELARKTANQKKLLSDPDDLIIHWMNYEEKLFRRLEKHIVEEALTKMRNQKIDVDAFIKFSLSVHNRRKSRAGHALENHLQVLFQNHGISFSYNKITENKSKPDFLFPGIDYYKDAAFDTSYLTMLGVKTSCKDRWRQVLSEAQRIDLKHLFTLEPAISIEQTNEMKAKCLQLVVPKSLHETYNSTQQAELLNLNQFIEIIKKREKYLIV